MNREAAVPGTSRLREGLRAFRDRYPWLGPVIWMTSTLYFAVQAFVALAWHPGYDLGRNTISDLGNTMCGSLRGATVCSPRHALMDVTLVVLGVVMASGSLLLDQEFAECSPAARRATTAGFSLMSVAGAGAAMVGIFPENLNQSLHQVGAGLAIGAGNVGILVIGLALALPRALRVFTVVSAVVSLVALTLFALGTYLGLGPGGMERVAAYPETVWLVWFGVYVYFRNYGPAQPQARAPAPDATTTG